MKRYPGHLSAIILSAFIAACSIVSKPILPVMHDLGPINHQTANRATITLDAPVWLWDDRIRYRLLYDDPTVIRYYNQDRWEAPLPALLERQLVIAGLQQNSHVQLQLIQFEQQFLTADSANVVMTLTASIFAENSIRLLGKRRFSFEQKDVLPNAAGAITGFVMLIGQAQLEIQSWLDTLSPVNHK